MPIDRNISYALSRAWPAPSRLDTTVITKLTNGQLRKRIVMLTALLDAAAKRCPDETVTLEAAFDLLAESQTTSPQAVHRLLTDPAVGEWLSRMLRRLHAAEDTDDQLPGDLTYLSAIAVAAAARSGHACSVDVPLRDGSIVLPTLGRVDVPGAATATATVEDGILRVGSSERITISVHAGTADQPGWLPLRRLTPQAGALTVDLDDLDDRLTEAEAEDWRSVLDEASTVLTGDNPGRAAAIAAGLRRIVHLTPTGTGEAASFTSRNAFGSVSMTPPRNALTCADTLIHEFHHSVLYALSDMVVLHRADDEAVHYSPWRDDPRPIEGLLHGAYSYLGVVDFWRGQRKVLAGTQRRFADFEFARWRRQVVQASRVLLDSTLLTDDGTAFVTGMVATAEQWLAIPVDDRTARLADQTVADHRLRWRLRHRIPDPADVATIVKARLAGERCPLDPAAVGGHTVPHPPGQPLGDRTRLAAIAVREPAGLATADGDPNDVRLLSGDLDEAHIGYLAAVRQAPHDIEAWAGLALCHPEGAALRTAPDVVRAVASGTDDFDLTALADWLDDRGSRQHSR